jgi:DNA-binding response OmpR family regulator
VEYQPSLDTPITLFPVGHISAADHSTEQRVGRTSTATRAQPSLQRRMLRFGGLSLDKLTGAIQWKQKSLALREDQRELLALLMENGGRILPLAEIAEGLGDPLDRAEERLIGLRASLRLAGVKCLPRRAAGLGYILWY